jgi:predicted GNAT family acetyltransferase
MTISYSASGIEYSSVLSDIDWPALIETLKEDNFYNGCTVEQIRTAFENSYLCCIVSARGKTIGTARILSDGVCNAYLVDVWTYTPFRRKGIASKMIDLLCESIQGQHIGLFTDEIPAACLYRKTGFEASSTFFEKVIGTWLKNEPPKASG